MESTLLIGMLAGAVGTGYLIYGKKQSKPVAMVCGALLIVYPYFTDNPWILALLGLALCVAPLLIQV